MVALCSDDSRLRELSITTTQWRSLMKRMHKGKQKSNQVKRKSKSKKTKLYLNQGLDPITKTKVRNA